MRLLELMEIRMCFQSTACFALGATMRNMQPKWGTRLIELPPFIHKIPTIRQSRHPRIKYPTGTQNYHHEVEFVVFIGKAGHNITADAAMDHVFGYACGLDMTRRDLQAVAKEKRRPWDLAKDVEQSAVIGTITPKGNLGDIGPQKIELYVNDKPVQSAHLSDMIHSVPDIICDLSKYYTLEAGDVIMTGTPAGVGPIVVGDKMDARIERLSNLVVTVEA